MAPRNTDISESNKKTNSAAKKFFFFKYLYILHALLITVNRVAQNQQQLAVSSILLHNKYKEPVVPQRDVRIDKTWLARARTHTVDTTIDNPFLTSVLYYPNRLDTMEIPAWNHYITETPSRINRACVGWMLPKPLKLRNERRQIYFSYSDSLSCLP